jgi:hypothetical protein
MVKDMAPTGMPTGEKDLDYDLAISAKHILVYIDRVQQHQRINWTYLLSCTRMNMFPSQH